MRIIFLITFALAAIPGLANSLSINDSSRTRYKYHNYFELSLSASSKQVTGAASWAHLHGFGKRKQKFKVGYGLRFTSFTGSDKEYITAPAELTSRRQDPGVLFSETFEESLDTVTFSSSQINSFNFSIQLQYSFSRKLDLGFNIDAVGFSFGQQKTGMLKSSLRPSGMAIEQSAKPTPYNALLISDNDIGSLNSELYLRYWFKEKWAIKGGFTFLFTEYTTNQKLIFDNDRFRYKTLMIMLGITYSPFRK